MVILGLGSNKGDRAAHLRQATGILAGLLTGMRASGLYESKALLPEGAPQEWDAPFLNMAVIGDTSLDPRALLVSVKAIEKQLGRQPAEKWAPREIDIDILAMGDTVLRTPPLSIPHRELLNRDFALLPLCELAPDWRYPEPGKYQGRRAADIAAGKGYRFNEELKRVHGAAHG